MTELIEGLKLDFTGEELATLLSDAAIDRRGRAAARDIAAQKAAEQAEAMERLDPGANEGGLPNSTLYANHKHQVDDHRSRAKALRSEAAQYEFQAAHLIRTARYRLGLGEVANLYPQK